MNSFDNPAIFENELKTRQSIRLRRNQSSSLSSMNHSHSNPMLIRESILSQNSNHVRDSVIRYNIPPTVVENNNEISTTPEILNIPINSMNIVNDINNEIKITPKYPSVLVVDGKLKSNIEIIIYCIVIYNII